MITNPKEPLKQLFVGGAAGAASRFLTAPLQRVRVVLMASKGGQTIPGVIAEVAKKEGVLGFWRGSTPRILKVMPGSAIQFAAFASVKNFFLKRSKVRARTGNDNQRKQRERERERERRKNTPG